MSVKIAPDIDKKFIGIPFKEHGRDFDGVDCLGLIYVWYREHGLVIEGIKTGENEISKFWWIGNPAHYIEGITQHGTLHSFSEVRKHDVILFFDPQNNSAMPVDAGVMVDDRHFLWMSERLRSSTRMLDAELKDKFWGALRPFEVVKAGLK